MEGEGSGSDQYGKAQVWVAQASLNNLCQFGGWSQKNPDLRMFNPKHYDKVKKLHTEFHKELGKVLHLALAGRRVAAQECCLTGGSYALALVSLATELAS